MDRSDATAHHAHDGHHHHHGVGTPHPAEVTPRSLLRMALPARLATATVICALLWAMVMTAMR